MVQIIIVLDDQFHPALLPTQTCTISLVDVILGSVFLVSGSTTVYLPEIFGKDLLQIIEQIPKVKRCVADQTMTFLNSLVPRNVTLNRSSWLLNYNCTISFSIYLKQHKKVRFLTRLNLNIP